MQNKILSFIIITLIVILSSITSVFASFADFTDEQADKQSQEQIKEQEKEHNVTEVKSSDNYLTSLQVEGYTLTPEFDKQTLEYTIKEEVNKNEINIKAITSDEKASVTGTGKLKIEDNKNEYRIDVTAENGSVRTYIIKLNIATTKENKKEEEIETKNEISKTEEVVTTKIENENLQQQEKKEENIQSNEIVYIIIACIIVILIILVLFSKNKKGKRIRKH